MNDHVANLTDIEEVKRMLTDEDVRFVILKNGRQLQVSRVTSINETKQSAWIETVGSRGRAKEYPLTEIKEVHVA